MFVDILLLFMLILTYHESMQQMKLIRALDDDNNQLIKSNQNQSQLNHLKELFQTYKNEITLNKQKRSSLDEYGLFYNYFKMINFIFFISICV